MVKVVIRTDRETSYVERASGESTADAVAESLYFAFIGAGFTSTQASEALSRAIAKDRNETPQS